MKPLISWFILLYLSCIHLQAQNDIHSGSLKLATGYALEYPGLGGYSINVEYDVPVYSSIQVGFGARMLQLSGYPRTREVNEYTKAETLDFNFYWLPLQTGAHTISLGLGYSFCFYNIRRAFAVSDNDIAKPIEWVSQESNGRTHGFSIWTEYTCHFKQSPFSTGLKVGIYKGYAYTYFAGPVIAFDF
jgi:hypothetical protein